MGRRKARDCRHRLLGQEVWRRDEREGSPTAGKLNEDAPWAGAIASAMRAASYEADWMRGVLARTCVLTVCVLVLVVGCRWDGKESRERTRRRDHRERTDEEGDGRASQTETLR